MKDYREWMTWLWLVICVCCCFLALYPHSHQWVDPSSGDLVKENLLGLRFSPLFESVRREAPRGGYHWQASIQWISWSSLSLVVGIFCFELFRQRRWGTRGVGCKGSEIKGECGGDPGVPNEQP